MADLQTRSRVVDVELPIPEVAQGNPRAQFAGMWADDPDWDRFQDAIAEYRHEIDQQSQTT